MLVWILETPAGVRLSAPVFFSRIGKTVSAPDRENLPMLVFISGGTDEDLGKLESDGFVCRKMTEQDVRVRSWPHGISD